MCLRVMVACMGAALATTHCAGGKGWRMEGCFRAKPGGEGCRRRKSCTARGQGGRIARDWGSKRFLRGGAGAVRAPRRARLLADLSLPARPLARRPAQRAAGEPPPASRP